MKKLAIFLCFLLIPALGWAGQGSFLGATSSTSDKGEASEVKDDGDGALASGGAKMGDSKEGEGKGKTEDDEAGKKDSSVNGEEKDKDLENSKKDEPKDKVKEEKEKEDKASSKGKKDDEKDPKDPKDSEKPGEFSHKGNQGLHLGWWKFHWGLVKNLHPSKYSSVCCCRVRPFGYWASARFDFWHKFRLVRKWFANWNWGMVKKVVVKKPVVKVATCVKKATVKVVKKVTTICKASCKPAPAKVLTVKKPAPPKVAKAKFPWGLAKKLPPKKCANVRPMLVKTSCNSNLHNFKFWEFQKLKKFLFSWNWGFAKKVCNEKPHANVQSCVRKNTVKVVKKVECACHAGVKPPTPGHEKHGDEKENKHKDEKKEKANDNSKKEKDNSSENNHKNESKDESKGESKENKG